MMDLIEEDLIFKKFEVNEIKRILSELNPSMEELSDADIMNLALILFELICNAHLDKENERKKVILKALIEEDDDLFFEALERLLNQKNEFITALFNANAFNEFKGDW